MAREQYSNKKRAYVNEIVLYNALAVRDLNAYSITVDTRGFSRRAFLVINTTDQVCPIVISAKSDKYTNTHQLVAKSIGAGNANAISIADSSNLNEPFTNLQVRFAFTVVPTSGSISIVMEED